MSHALILFPVAQSCAKGIDRISLTSTLISIDFSEGRSLIYSPPDKDEFYVNLRILFVRLA